jgi:hypothetical protein
MNIVAFFLPQGMVIGECIQSSADTMEVRNPALVITRQNDVMLAPFLQLVEETSITIKFEDLAFKQVFTPIQTLTNHYNQIYGSGLVVTNVLPM